MKVCKGGALAYCGEICPADDVIQNNKFEVSKIIIKIIYVAYHYETPYFVNYVRFLRFL
jgi:hypothetical protein